MENKKQNRENVEMFSPYSFTPGMLNNLELSYLQLQSALAEIESANNILIDIMNSLTGQNRTLKDFIVDDPVLSREEKF